MLAHLLTALTTLMLSFLQPHSLHTQVLASYQKASPTLTNTITPVFSPTVTPTLIPTIKLLQKPLSVPQSLIDCVGPDGKHLHITEKQCINFNAAWQHIVMSASPTPAWGIATKVGEHTYSMKFTPDNHMANAQEIFQALNTYRQKDNAKPLMWDDKLSAYAQSRTNFYTANTKLDEHAGFIDYLNNHDGFAQLGFNKVGENAALAGPLSGIHLIEEVYAGDSEHNTNQLNTSWNFVGVGVNGNYTDIIFAGEKR